MCYCSVPTESAPSTSWSSSQELPSTSTGRGRSRICTAFIPRTKKQIQKYLDEISSLRRTVSSLNRASVIIPPARILAESSRYLNKRNPSYSDAPTTSKQAWTTLAKRVTSVCPSLISFLTLSNPICAKYKFFFYECKLFHSTFLLEIILPYPNIKVNRFFTHT